MKPTKKLERLQARIRNWQQMPTSKEGKVINRYEQKGYRCPGSRQR